MRVESDRQGHHRSGAPACHRCGIPLLEDATFCPYCEQSLDTSVSRIHAGVAAGPTQLTRTLLSIGVVFFAVVAFACLTAAFII